MVSIKLASFVSRNTIKSFAENIKLLLIKFQLCDYFKTITNVLTTDVVNNASVYKFFKGRKAQGLNTTLSESYSNVS